MNSKYKQVLIKYTQSLWQSIYKSGLLTCGFIIILVVHNIMLSLSMYGAYSIEQQGKLIGVLAYLPEIINVYAIFSWAAFIYIFLKIWKFDKLIYDMVILMLNKEAKT